MNHLRWRTTLGSGRWPTVRSQVEPWKFYLPAIRLQQRANCLNFKQIFFLPFKLQIAVNILLPQKNQIQMSEKSARSHKLYRTENNHIRFSWIKLNEFCLCFFFFRLQFLRFALHNKTMNQKDDNESKWASINSTQPTRKPQSQAKTRRKEKTISGRSVSEATQQKHVISTKT